MFVVSCWELMGESKCPQKKKCERARIYHKRKILIFIDWETRNFHGISRSYSVTVTFFGFNNKTLQIQEKDVYMSKIS